MRTTRSKWLSTSSTVAVRRGLTKAAMAVMPMTPPRAAMARITASDLQRGLSAMARQLEWVISTGFFEAAKASRQVRSEQWETSTAMPTRFMAATTSAP